MPFPLQAGLRVESLHTAADYRDAAALYTRVFGYSGSDFGLNAHLLTALRKNGGSTIGAFDASDGDLIGFVYGFAATDASGAHFHYSQAAAVDPLHQGRGIGRQMKLAQREVARAWGQTRMRWTFDPLLTRNAHFNLVSLGANGVRFERDFYDRPDSDRLVVDWDLSGADDPYRDHRHRLAPVGLSGRFGDALDAGAGAVWVAVPEPRAPRAAGQDEKVRSGLEAALVGRRLVSCAAVDASTSAYLAVPMSREGS